MRASTILHFLGLFSCIFAVQYDSVDGTASYAPRSAYELNSCEWNNIQDVLFTGVSNGTPKLWADGVDCGKYLLIRRRELAAVCKTTKTITVVIIDLCDKCDAVIYVCEASFTKLTVAGWAEATSQPPPKPPSQSPFEPSSSTTNLAPSSTSSSPVGEKKNGVNLRVVIAAVACSAVILNFLLQAALFIKRTRLFTSGDSHLGKDGLVSRSPEATRFHQDNEIRAATYIPSAARDRAPDSHSLHAGGTEAVGNPHHNVHKGGSCLGEADLEHYKPKVRQVSNHLFELFPRAVIGSPEADLVLFHGPTANEKSSKEAYWQNWVASNTNGQSFLNYLIDDFPNSRIHAVSYDSRVTGEEQLDYYLLAENLETDILATSINPGIGQTCPLVLIGHSTGGNVIDHFILKLAKRMRSSTQMKYELFLENLSGIFYFSTPHLGMDIAALLACIGLPDIKYPTPGTLFRKQLDKGLARLIAEAREWYERSHFRVKLASVWEGPLENFDATPRIVRVCTNLQCKNCNRSRSFQIVAEASARPLQPHADFFTATGVNHFTVCIPNSSRCKDSTYIFLRDFIDRSAGGVLTKGPRYFC